MTILRAKLQLITDWLWVEADDDKWLALIVCAALAVRVVWTLAFQTPPVSDACGI